MSVHPLYNSSGTLIAFRIGKNIFDPSGEWAGWLPWEDDYAVSPDGKYLGTISADRLFCLKNPPKRGFAGYPVYPGAQSKPALPGSASVVPLPATATDIVAV